MATMAAPAKGRISGADGVRALAALGVIFHHLFQKLQAGTQSPWLQDVHGMIIKGAAGVSVFFVLSGMLLSYPFWRAYFEKRPLPSLRHYVARRAARIMPGFYAALAVSFVVTAAIARNNGAHVTQPLRRLIAGATFTSEFHWITFFPDDTNGPLWSIGFEVFCYVLLPLFMLGLFAVKRRGRRIAWGYWVAAFALVLAVNQWVTTTFIPDDHGRGWEYGVIGGAKLWMPGYNPVGFFGHFTMGIFAAGFIAMWTTFHAGRRHWGFDVAAGLAGAGILALFWAKRYPVEMDNTLSFQHQPYFFPLLAGMVAILLCGLAFSTVLGRAFDNPLFRYTAKVSFGLYIWHYLIILWVGRALEPDFLNYGGVADPWRLLEIGAFVLIVSYGVATVSWHLIERPFLEGRFSGRRKNGAAKADASRADIVIGWLRRPRVSVSVTFFVNGLLLASWAPHVPDVREHLDLTEGVLGTALLAGAVGAVSAMTLAAPLSARIGPHRLAMIAGVTLACVAPLPVIAPNLWTLVLALFAWGASIGSMDLAMNAVAADVEHRAERPLMSGFHGMFSFGALVGSVIAFGLIRAGLTPLEHMALMAALVLVGAWPSFRALPPATRGMDDAGAASSGKLRWPGGALLVIGVIALIVLAAEGAVENWSALVLKENFGSTASFAALGYGALSLTMAVFRFLGDAINARVGPVLLLASGAGIAGAGLALGMIVATPWAGVVGFGIMGIGLANTVPDRVLRRRRSRAHGGGGAERRRRSRLPRVHRRPADDRVRRASDLAPRRAHLRGRDPRCRGAHVAGRGARGGANDRAVVDLIVPAQRGPGREVR